MLCCDYLIFLDSNIVVNVKFLIFVSSFLKKWLAKLILTIVD